MPSQIENALHISEPDQMRVYDDYALCSACVLLRETRPLNQWELGGIPSPMEGTVASTLETMLARLPVVRTLAPSEIRPHLPVKHAEWPERGWDDSHHDVECDACGVHCEWPQQMFTARILLGEEPAPSENPEPYDDMVDRITQSSEDFWLDLFNPFQEIRNIVAIHREKQDGRGHEGFDALARWQERLSLYYPKLDVNFLTWLIQEMYPDEDPHHRSRWVAEQKIHDERYPELCSPANDCVFCGTYDH